MTYSELLAAIDLYALEKPSLALGYKAAVIALQTMHFSYMGVAKGTDLLDYIPDAAKEQAPNSESETMTLVRWT